MTNTLSQAQRRGLGAVIAVLLGLRVWFHLTASPLPDEAYYWLWGRNLDWSYFDHPPLQAWMQAASHGLFGTSLFALRAPALLTSAVVLGCVLWWARRFGAEGGPVLATVAVALTSPLLFLMTGIVFPDHLMIALLSLALIQIFLVCQDQIRGQIRLRHLYLAGLFLGLAGLTKYNAALFALGAVAMVVFAPALRPLLRNPHFYGAAGLALLCLAPVFYWNATHGAASFQYNLNDRITRVDDAMAYLRRIAVFALGFGVALSPLLLAGILGRGFRQRSQGQSAVLRQIALWIFAVSCVVCLGLTYFVPIIYYWNIVAVVALIPLMGLILRGRLMALHLGFGLLFNAALVVNHTVFPLSAWGGRVDDETALMYGWPQITAEVQAKGGDFVITTDYRSASILGFWLNRADVGVIAQRVSQFTLWFDGAARAGQDAVILSSDAFPITDLIRQRFAKLEDLGAIEVSRFGHDVTRYHLHRGVGLVAPLPLAQP